MIHIEIINALSDNYIYLLRNDKENITAVIDPGEAEPISRFLRDNNLNLNQIINTHHHNDHTGGNKELKKIWGATIIAPSYEKGRIPNVDIYVSEGDSISIAGENAQVIHTPGHTLDHICFYIPDQKFLFSGDTLFYLGCGRVFEGTMKQMWNSLLKLKSLPDDTLVYCGHEYTLSNSKFSIHIDPNNQLLKKTSDYIKNTRAKNLSTIPFSLGQEKLINPFLRADDKILMDSLSLNIDNPEIFFKEIRNQKDNF